VGAASGLAPETRIALNEYQPLHYADQIPKTTAVLFVTAEKDGVIDNEANAGAARTKVQGATEVITVKGATHPIASPDAFEAAANASVEWFLKHL